MDSKDRIRACYQHASLFVTGNDANHAPVRRGSRTSAQASRLIRESVSADLSD